MSTQTENELKAGNVAEAASVKTTKKRNRRGISNETRSKALIKFDEKRDANKANALFIGHLENVEVKLAKIGEDVTGLPQFAGQEIPVLVFNFESNHDDVNERRHVSMRLMPAESNATTIPGGKDAWKVESVLGWMKHILDVFVLKGRQMTEEEEDLLSLPFEDFDENGQYVPVEAENVVKGWVVLFNNYVNMLNNEGKPVYKAKDGGILPIWMKLLRFVKNKGQWNPVVRGKSTMGDLGFTVFVGEGCIELFKQDKAPMLKVDVNRESVVYREIAKQPTNPAAMNPTLGGMMPNAGIPTPMVTPAQPAVTPAPAADAFGIGSGSPFATGNPADDLPF